MDLIRYNKRLIHRNPIEPFSWRALYYGGGSIAQFDFDSYHTSRDIDRTRLAALIILGHAYSPIEIPVPYPERVCDEVIIKATIDMRIIVGGGNGQRTVERIVRYFFGYRYGVEKCLVEVDELGRLFKTNTDLGQGTGADDARWQGGGF